MFKGFFKSDKKHGYGIKFSVLKTDSNDKENTELSNTNNEKKTIILVGNWVDNLLEGIALGISPSSYKVEKIYKFATNKLKSTTADDATIKEKTVTNRDCTNLLSFYYQYKDKE